MNKGERALKNVRAYKEYKEHYHYIITKRKKDTEMEKVNKYGWVWNLINGLYWCKTPIESGIYCGITPEELDNKLYYIKIGGKIK